MKLTIEVNTDNAAFKDNHSELRNILSDVAGSIELMFDNVHRISRSFYDGIMSASIIDSNGNTVGCYKIESTDD